MGHVLTYLP